MKMLAKYHTDFGDLDQAVCVDFHALNLSAHARFWTIVEHAFCQQVRVTRTFNGQLESEYFHLFLQTMRELDRTQDYEAVI